MRFRHIKDRDQVEIQLANGCTITVRGECVIEAQGEGVIRAHSTNGTAYVTRTQNFSTTSESWQEL